MKSSRTSSSKSCGFFWVAAGGVLSLLGCGGDETKAAGTPQTAAAAARASTESAQCELPSGGYPGGCNECLAAQCCAPIAACREDASCAAQLTCVVDCQHAADPVGCSAACTEQGPLPGYTEYDDCSF